MDTFLAKAIIKTLLLPPIGPILLIAAGLIMAARWRRAGHALAWFGLLALFALCLPISERLLLTALEVPPVFDIARARDAQAIVILGGGLRRYAPEYHGATVNRRTLERVRYGAKIARETALPVLVTGGALWTAETEAQVMKAALEREFGVPVRWTEERSRNTHENAIFTAAALRGDGIARVVLVGHAADMKRASAEFQRAGLHVVPAPVGLRAEEEVTWRDFVPGLASFNGSYDALYELLGNLALAVRSLRL